MAAFAAADDDDYDDDHFVVSDEEEEDDDDYPEEKPVKCQRCYNPTLDCWIYQIDGQSKNVCKRCRTPWSTLLAGELIVPYEEVGVVFELTCDNSEVRYKGFNYLDGRTYSWFVERLKLFPTVISCRWKFIYTNFGRSYACKRAADTFCAKSSSSSIGLKPAEKECKWAKRIGVAMHRNDGETKEEYPDPHPDDVYYEVGERMTDSDNPDDYTFPDIHNDDNNRPGPHAVSIVAAEKFRHEVIGRFHHSILKYKFTSRIWYTYGKTECEKRVTRAKTHMLSIESSMETLLDGPTKIKEICGAADAIHNDMRTWCTMNTNIPAPAIQLILMFAFPEYNELMVNGLRSSFITLYSIRLVDQAISIGYDAETLNRNTLKVQLQSDLEREREQEKDKLLMLLIVEKRARSEINDTDGDDHKSKRQRID